MAGVPFWSAASEYRTLTIEVKVPEGTGTVYMAGNLPELGPWNPSLFALQGTGRERRAVLEVPEGTEVRFKLTEGSWAREAVDMQCTVPGDSVVLVERDTVYTVEVQRFRNPGQECVWPDPLRWEAAIAAFEAVDRESPPPPGMFLATGSSSIALWHPSIGEDLAPLEVLPRGFGGSTIHDMIHFFPRVVQPYSPSAILLYEGDNDVAAGMFPTTIVRRFEDFFALVREHLPTTRVYVIAIKPSPSRWDQWDRQREVNEALAGICEKDENLFFIDIASPMLCEDGKPKPELFADDMLHINNAGYALWAEKIRAVVFPRELGQQ
jgi:lysophospholipase L1-like esterase